MKQKVLKRKYKIGVAIVMISLFLCACTDSQVSDISNKIDSMKKLSTEEIEDKKLIEEIETMYSNLTDEQKKSVKNYDNFISSKKEIEKAIKEQQAEQEEEQIIKTINKAVKNCSLKYAYSSIYAYKDHSVITIKVTTSGYIWDAVQISSDAKKNYKSDFSTIYKSAVSATSEFKNVPEIDILVVEPNGDSLATGQGTSNVKFLFE